MDCFHPDGEPEHQGYVSPRRLPAAQATTYFDPRHPTYVVDDSNDPDGDDDADAMDTCPEGKILHYTSGTRPHARVSQDCRRCFSRGLEAQRRGYAYCADCGYAVCGSCVKNCTPPGVLCHPPPPPTAPPLPEGEGGLEYPRLPDRKTGRIRASAAGFVAVHESRAAAAAASQPPGSTAAAAVAAASSLAAQVYAPPVENGLLLPCGPDTVPPCADAAVRMLGLHAAPKPGLLRAVDPKAVLGGEPGESGPPLGRTWVVRGDDVVQRGGGACEAPPAATLVCYFDETHGGLLRVARVVRSCAADAAAAAVAASAAGGAAAEEEARTENMRRLREMLRAHASEGSASAASSAPPPESAGVTLRMTRENAVSRLTKAEPRRRLEGLEGDDVVVEHVEDERTTRRNRLIPPPPAGLVRLRAARVLRVTEAEAEAIRDQQHKLETELIEVSARCLVLMDACTHADRPCVSRKKGSEKRGYYCEYAQCTWCGKVLAVNSQEKGRNGTTTYRRTVFDQAGESKLVRNDAFAEFREPTPPPLLCGMKRGDGCGWTRKVVLLLPEMQQLHRRDYIHTADFRQLAALRAAAPKLLPFEGLWRVAGDEGGGGGGGAATAAAGLEGFVLPRQAAQVLVGPSQLVNGCPPLNDRSDMVAFLRQLQEKDAKRKAWREGQRSIHHLKPV